MNVVNSASALGEAIGKLIEDEIEYSLQPLCNSLNYTYDHGGSRPGRRKGVKLSMVNKSGNTYQLDGIIESPDGKPVVIIESKYLRYKKHNRDKASWTCSAHYSLRKSHPSIRKSIAVLSGNWSLPAKKFMESFGIELYEISFDYMCSVLRTYHIEFNWSEKDRTTPEISWKKFNQLSDKDRVELRASLLDPVRDDLVKSIELSLKGGEDWKKRIVRTELLLVTDRHEYFTYSFESAKDTIQFLLDLQIDAPDLSDKL